MGTPEFAVPILARLIQSDYKPAAVFCAPDKPVGRKQILTPPLTKVLAQENNIPAYQPANSHELADIMKSLSYDIVITAAYGLIFPKEVLDAPQYGCLNVHPSLLPKYRGASPIQSAILAGDQSTGVTLMEMDQQMDHGPIIAQEFVEISAVETTGSLILKTALTGAQLLIDNLPKYLDGSLSPTDQDHQQATFCQMIKKIDGQIDWTKPAIEIDRQVRALNIWPKASTTFCGKHLIIHSGHISGNQYIPDLVQLEGRKIIRWQDFLNGQRISESQALLELTAKM